MTLGYMPTLEQALLTITPLQSNEARATILALYLTK